VFILFESFLPVISNADTTQIKPNEIRGFEAMLLGQQAKFAERQPLNPAKTAQRKEIGGQRQRAKPVSYSSWVEMREFE
jgi:hypothetical protein